MTAMYMTDVRGGSLLPDDASTDFELDYEGPDFEIIERGSIPRPPTTSPGNGAWGIAGLMLVPSPA